MQTIKSLYKIGNGPSSSHTVGPHIAAQYMKYRYPDAKFHVTLYGSLATTGSGHGTQKAILDVISDALIRTDPQRKDLPHPNTMDFDVIYDGNVRKTVRVQSIGGGNLLMDDEGFQPDEDIYPEKNFNDILRFCKNQGINLAEYAYFYEGISVKEHVRKAWQAMESCVRRGLSAEGILPGGLNVERKAQRLYESRCYNESIDVSKDRTIASFAFAVAEESAMEHVIVTAPTCGSCGVIPAVLYYMRYYKGFPEEEIIDALVVAAVVGNVIRTNASISGAECGCQAEIGSACSMAAAAYAHLIGLNLDQIEYAAEIAMEHHLGLTCDPVKGLVQIPCIERNAVAALRAMNAGDLARFLFTTRKVSFDTVVETMYQTGKDMDARYRETAHGGLAVLYEG